MASAFPTPVVLCVFNRPDTTQTVFEAIRRARPARLYVVADGPRDRGDRQACQQVRQIIDTLDWPCELHTNYAETNLGCGERIVSGLDWVFDQVDQAIVLEDDCLPDPSFFPFCETLLDHYRHDPRVMHIGGHNRLMQWRPQTASYFGTYLYGSPWGWATWRRAWRCFRRESDAWRQLAHDPTVAERLPNREVYDSFLHPFKNYSMEQLQSEWGFIWTLSKLLSEGLSIVPSKNLVSNIGIGAGATHTRGAVALLFQNTPRYAMEFPLRHPSALVADREYEYQHLLWYQGRSDPRLLLPLVHHLRSQNRHVHALLVLEKILQTTPSSPDARELKASLLQQLGR